MKEPVTCTVDDGVLLVTLDRPKANAVDVPTSHALYEAFARLRDDDTLRVGVLTGAGDRFFSAGWDLKAEEAVDADHGPGGFGGITELFDLDKPVIAAVNGLAFGGGFELVLAADLVVTASHAEFSLPEVTLGLVPDSGGMLRLPRRLPSALAAELLLTGRRIGAAEAYDRGLVNRVTTSDALLDSAFDLAREICAAAPLAVAAVKQVTRATAGMPLPGAFATMRSGNLAAYQAVLTSADAVEGPRAFAEGRTPRWTGR